MYIEQETDVLSLSYSKVKEAKRHGFIKYCTRDVQVSKRVKIGRVKISEFRSESGQARKSPSGNREKKPRDWMTLPYH